MLSRPLMPPPVFPDCSLLGHSCGSVHNTYAIVIGASRTYATAARRLHGRSDANRKARLSSAIHRTRHRLYRRTVCMLDRCMLKMSLVGLTPNPSPPLWRSDCLLGQRTIISNRYRILESYAIVSSGPGVALSTISA